MPSGLSDIDQLDLKISQDSFDAINVQTNTFNSRRINIFYVFLVLLKGGFKGLNEASEVPRLPDPNVVFPPTPRRRCAPERPKTLDFVARPRPSPRGRGDVFLMESRGRGNGQTHGNGESPAHTTSTETPPTVEFGRDPAVLPTPMEAPTPFSPRRNQNLLDQLDEGQYRDGTVPLCKAESNPKESASTYSYGPGFFP